MKFIKKISIITFLAITSVSCQKKADIYSVPEYRLIKDFSNKTKEHNGLVLNSFGVNMNPPVPHTLGLIGDFKISYKLQKKKTDYVSIKEARGLLISVGESLLNEINSNSLVNQELDVLPFTRDRIILFIHFIDENEIDLGQGICQTHLINGKIKYERYDIHEYTGKFPADGMHYVVHEESYEEALDIVKKQGLLTYY